MNHILHKTMTLAAISLLLLLTTVSGYAFKPMPPSFSFENDPADILSNYPLGIITEQDAFAHHGGPIRKEVLPNGHKGWIYKAGEDIGVPNIYVLLFSREGIVIDVLHKDYRHEIGHSALQYQYLSDKDPMSRMLGPRPGE